MNQHLEQLFFAFTLSLSSAAAFSPRRPARQASPSARSHGAGPVCHSLGISLPQSRNCPRLRGPGEAHHAGGSQSGTISCFSPLSRCSPCVQSKKVWPRIKVFGRWVYAMGAGDPQPYHKALESMKSSWIELSPTNDPRVVTLRWGDRCL